MSPRERRTYSLTDHALDRFYERADARSFDPTARELRFASDMDRAQVRQLAETEIFRGQLLADQARVRVSTLREQRLGLAGSERVYVFDDHAWFVRGEGVIVTFLRLDRQTLREFGMDGWSMRIVLSQTTSLALLGAGVLPAEGMNLE